MENTIQFVGSNHGYASSSHGVATFEIQGYAEREDIRAKEYRTIYSKYAADRYHFQLEGGFTIPMWGDGHNLYPQEVYTTISENKLLPEVIRKKVHFLFGKGPRLYREVVVGEESHQRRVRVPVEDPEIMAWLESWEKKGQEHYWEYLKNVINDYYHVKTAVTKYHYNRGRRLGNQKPIDALSYVGSDQARLAFKGNFNFRQIKNQDCKYVIVGDWLNISNKQYDVFHRFSPAEPFKHPVAIAFNTDKTFSKWVYAYNDWFTGLLDWIKASNLSPKYLNSYLKNALNAHVHVVIPGTWYMQMKNTLEQICQTNLMGDPDIALETEFKGVSLVDSNGKPYRFSENMMEDLIANELRRITELMTGEGKNQGKMWASTKWGEDGWKFEEFPHNLKEYFTSVLDLDKRADQVILASLGMSSSITNVENDGVISKSGADVYYNWLIYVASLTLDEYFVMKEINRAIHLNFPRAEKEGIKLGFWIEIPAKQEDTTPSQRLSSTATPDAK